MAQQIQEFTMMPDFMTEIHNEEERILAYIRDEKLPTHSTIGLINITEQMWNDLEMSHKYNKNFIGAPVCSLEKPLWTVVQQKLALLKQHTNNNVIIAGGAIFCTLFDLPISDVDLFFVGINEETAIDHIKKSSKGAESVLRTTNAITITIDEDIREIQYILRLYKSISEVLHGFDVDSCCIGYDGSEIWCTERFWHCLVKGFNTVNLNRLSPSYETRLLKYAKRGIPIYVDKYDYTKADKKAFNIYLKRHRHKMTGLDILIYFDMARRNNCKKPIYRTVQKIIEGDYGDTPATIGQLYNIGNGDHWKSIDMEAYLEKMCVKYKCNILIPSQKTYCIMVKKFENIDILLNIPDDLFHPINVVCEFELSQKIMFKVVNPGEQTTGSFKKYSISDPKEWYVGMFYPSDKITTKIDE